LWRAKRLYPWDIRMSRGGASDVEPKVKFRGREPAAVSGTPIHINTTPEHCTLLLLLFLYDMFRQFLRPSPDRAYKCLTEKFAAETELLKCNYSNYLNVRPLLPVPVAARSKA
jgi:hypothetical protein